jgi:glycerol-3-phosphate dehydrogenase (NAD(P)+)
LGGLGHVAEGVTTAKSAHDLALKLGVELPISMEVYRVLYEDVPVKHAVRDLLLRPPGKEWP